jgi:hypothetical protein
MKPLKRNPEESHDPVRPTEGMELKAGTSLLVGRSWISRKKSGRRRNVFLDILSYGTQTGVYTHPG